MNMSLDGYIEGPKGSRNWSVGSDEHWRDLSSVLEGVDTFVVGRGMYPGYAQHWTAALTNPTASEKDRAFAQLAQRTKHVVVSRTLQSADFSQTSIVRDLDGVSRLKQEPGKSIMVWGGAALASALNGAGLVDELQLLVNPVILGDGKALFRDVAAPQRLTLAETRMFGTEVVLLRYQPRA
jgi:dihydrofolate reductase